MLPSLQQRWNVQQVFLKDESGRFGLPAFKILGASWAVYRALCDRFNINREEARSLTDLQSRIPLAAQCRITSATDGNHGRAVARVAKLLGLPATIFMPAGSSMFRIRAIEDEGATVVVGGTYDDAVALAARAAGEEGLLIQDTAFPGYENIPGWIVEGYSTCLWEIDESLEASGMEAPTHVFVQMGVGSLAEAVVRHYRGTHSDDHPTMIGVEPDDAACVLESMKLGSVVTLPGEQHSIMAGLNCGTMSLTAFPVLKNGVEWFVTVSDDRAREAMRLLAKDGIISGETGSAGLAGLIEITSEPVITKEIGITSTSRVLVISTEGATDPDSYQAITGLSDQKG